MMSKPAFARSATNISKSQEGMNLLEYYAGQALIGLIANGGDACVHDGKAAQWSFDLAQAMIEESEKRQK